MNKDELFLLYLDIFVNLIQVFVFFPDYSCALQKDILVHGRLYVTPNYFCFYSKIFGWETFVSVMDVYFVLSSCYT